jgi:hypothetical protein
MAIWVGGKLAFLILEHGRSRFDVDCCDAFPPCFIKSKLIAAFFLYEKNELLLRLPFSRNARVRSTIKSLQFL